MEHNQKNLHFRTLNKSDNLNTIKMNGGVVWFRSAWCYQGVNAFFYSFDGQRFVPCGETTSLTWGSYRGNRIGIFNYKTLEDAGFVDLDWMNYQY